MMCARDIRFASLRLLLAALIALASLAGARMQGQMGAEAALASALGSGVLCSGQTAPGSGGEAPVAAHESCITCNLPAAESGCAARTALPPEVFEYAFYTVPPRTEASQRAIVSPARGPPFQV